jgi:hypothetical protein
LGAEGTAMNIIEAYLLIGLIVVVVDLVVYLMKGRGLMVGDIATYVLAIITWPVFLLDYLIKLINDNRHTVAIKGWKK